MKRKLDAVRLWLARWVLPAGFVVSRESALREASYTLGELLNYSLASGHLTRAYHAGKRVRTFTEHGQRALRESIVP